MVSIFLAIFRLDDRVPKEIGNSHRCDQRLLLMKLIIQLDWSVHNCRECLEIVELVVIDFERGIGCERLRCRVTTHQDYSCEQQQSTRQMEFTHHNAPHNALNIV